MVLSGAVQRWSGDPQLTDAWVTDTRTVHRAAVLRLFSLRYLSQVFLVFIPEYLTTY